MSQALAALSALSQESRLAIYRLLVEHGQQGMAAGAIAERLELPAATLSFHLKELSSAGLIVARQDGRFIWYRADFDAVTNLIAYMTENCCRSGSTCDPGCIPTTAHRPTARKRSATHRRAK